MSKALLIVDVQNGFVNEKTKHIPTRVETFGEAYKKGEACTNEDYE